MRTVIEQGLVIDPANRVNSVLNVVIEDGKVAALTPEPVAADRRIPAAGKVVCPGFIDIHMHEAPLDDLEDLDRSIFSLLLRQGVTTAVGGNCGDSVLPPLQYLDRVAGGIPVNLCMLAPHGAAREAAGYSDKYATLTAPQIDRVAGLLRDWLEGGCYGVSYGIRYFPGMDMAELMATASVCAGTDLLVAAHVRDDADYIFDALEEFMAPGRRYGLRLQVSHLGSMGGYGQMARCLSLLDGARLAGLDVMADCYPYSAFSTGIGSCTYDPGFLERYHCGYGDIQICEGKYKGVPCTEAIFRELYENQPDTITVAAVMDPADVRLAMAHPAVMLCTDGTTHGGQGHPRAAGAFPRLIAQYVRTGTLTLYDAIEKMTAMPARRLGLSGKGNLAPGSDGDVVIFDPETIRDLADFDRPDLPPAGIDLVLVGGEAACENGRVLNHRLGRPLRRG